MYSYVIYSHKHQNVQLAEDFEILEVRECQRNSYVKFVYQI